MRNLTSIDRHVFATVREIFKGKFPSCFISNEIEWLTLYLAQAPSRETLPLKQNRILSSGLASGVA